MTEIKGVSGIDVAVSAMIEELKEKSSKALEEVLPLAAIAVTADNIPARKADRAKVNKLRKAFDDERKSVEKAWKSAINPIVDEYKRVVKDCDNIIESIDEDLVGFEETRKEEKKSEIMVLFMKTIRSDVPQEIKDMPAEAVFEKLYNPKWLNATYKLDSIEQEMKDFFASLKISFETIKAMHHEWEDEGIAMFLRTFSLQDAIQHMAGLSEQARIIREREEEAKRKSEELKAKEAEKVKEEPKEEPKEEKHFIEVLDSEPFGMNLPFEAVTRFVVEIPDDRIGGFLEYCKENNFFCEEVV